MSNVKPAMFQIKVQYRQYQQYKIMETVDFGYRLSVLSNIAPDENGIIVYDANKAQIKLNKQGYLTMYIDK